MAYQREGAQPQAMERQRNKPAQVEAGGLKFVIKHEVWDQNIHDHGDQGVAILVLGQVSGKETTLLRFNCFDIDRSYIYGPEGKNKLCRMDPTVDGNAIAWTMRQLKDNLATMITEAGYESVARQVKVREVQAKLGEVESLARKSFATDRSTVKHNRGTDMFEAGNIRFGLEMRTQSNGDGGLAIHVLSDLAGTPGKAYMEETELLAFDCFREAPHYHYGPRNKNYRIFWDKVLVPDTLEWTLQQFKAGKLRDMIQRAGYPGVAADIDQGLIDAVLPVVEAKAREMQPKVKASR
ncbi:MAG: hypothetical protein FJ316_01645 [SAR202 cluster bacterium]|nr:hypothetical protein [SAR202 cluster bacterium]